MSQPENQRVKGWTGGRVPTPLLQQSVQSTQRLKQSIQSI